MPPLHKVVAYVFDSNGRHPDIEKIKKILDWPPCKSVTEAKAFIGLCVYYRIWIRDFTHIADPIFETFRKKKSKKNKKAGKYGGERERGEEEIERVFKWGPEQEKAMRDLKHALVSPPALLPIVYTAEPGKKTPGRIVLGVDASRLGYGAILQPEDENGR